MAYEVTIPNGPPVAVYPYALQDVKTIKNTGTVSVFITTDAVAVNGVELVVGDAIVWSRLERLYMYVETGVGTAQVFDGEVPGLANVNAEVTGEVTIAAPVLIQGGGELLASGTANLAILGSETIPIPLGVEGLRYPAYLLSIYSSQADAAFEWAVRSASGTGYSVDGLQASWGTNYPFNNVQYTFIPVNADDMELFMRNIETTVGNDIEYSIWGVTTAVTSPETDLSDQERGVFNASVTSGVQTDVWLPPSHDPFTVVFSTTATMTVSALQRLSGASGATSIQQRSPIAAGATGTNVIRVPGSGAQHLLRFTIGSTTNVTISIVKGLF